MISSVPMRRHKRNVVRNQETKRVQRSTSRIRARPRGTKRMRGRSHEKPSEQNSPNRVHGGRNSAIDDRLRQENGGYAGRHHKSGRERYGAAGAGFSAYLVHNATPCSRCGNTQTGPTNKKQ